jgi:hypothetical protein
LARFRDITAVDLYKGFKAYLTDALSISLMLFKIMIPVSIAVKVLESWGVIHYMALVLEPFMEMVGLPGSMGLVWATGMLTNLYGAMVVFVSLTDQYPLTVAQATVLTSMMLVAHSLPVELKIAQKAGARIRAMGSLRIVGAFVLGFCLSRLFQWGEWLQQPNTLSWTVPVNDPSLKAWAWGEVRNIIMIFLIILGLLALMKILKWIGFTDLLTKLLRPVLLPLGIGESATTITMIGMTLGISYGGGIIIREAKKGEIHRRDIFFSMALMGLSHGLIEDTMIMMLLGGHLIGIFCGRLIFSLAVVYVMVKIVSRLPESVLDRYLFRSAK